MYKLIFVSRRSNGMYTKGSRITETAEELYKIIAYKYYQINTLLLMTSNI